ncbi:MAG TPA: heme lyase CcmF/NrfE family subunit, partial [Coxiellaceae bacterium]|nr:heme lyase CcmF/NrfE family subunit [Coxiellaceae bacterium]
YAFITNDFSVRYVAENSNSTLPLIYRFCAVWGAHEGSLLLWVYLLTLWMAAVSIFSLHLPLTLIARILAVLSMVAAGFYLFILLTSDPFARLLTDIPLNGRDLNPLLQDPGLVIHPPMLYMGYVGFSVAFAFVIAALMEGKLDATWARWTRPWTLIAWVFLTYGIVAGSWWAYRELGWGGWWFWDPVENASFLPWLAGTALIHSLIVTEKRNAFKAWTAFLAICCFSLSLLGTFLVRSGVLISVHAFATDPHRGEFLLAFLMLVIGCSLALYAWRARSIKTEIHDFNFFSREAMLLSNNIILFVAMLTVLLGTVYPLFMDELGLAKLSVGYPYFNAVFIPLMIPLFFLMGVAPWCHWKHTHADLKQPLIAMFVLVCILAYALPWLAGVQTTFQVTLALSLALWIAFNALIQLLKTTHLRQWAMIVAHLGVAVTVVGISLTTAYSQQRNLSMELGDEIAVGPYQFQLVNLTNITGPNYHGVAASIKVIKDHQLLTILYPEQRIYNVSKAVKAKTAIKAGLFSDFYVALGTPLDHAAWSVRIYYKPFVRWIWAGGLMMVLGGILGVWAKRRKF